MEAMLIRCISPLGRSAKHTGCSAPSALFSHRHARKVRAARARILLDRGDDLGAQCTGALAPGERATLLLSGGFVAPARSRNRHRRASVRRCPSRRRQRAAKEKRAQEHGLIAVARQQIFWKLARQRRTLTGGSASLLPSAEIVSGCPKPRRSKKRFSSACKLSSSSAG